VNDWVAWHAEYDQPGSRLQRRLGVVQQRLGEALDRCPPGPVRLVSLCAGQGRDVLAVLPRHPRGRDVSARLVEADAANAAAAREAVDRHGLHQVEVVHGDASTSSVYAGAVPADVILACGIFGHVSNEDIECAVGLLPSLCSAGATVIWTRHRNAPDLTPTIRAWFGKAGFDEVAFDAPADASFGVGTARLARAPAPFRAGVRLFTFDR
jgi:hypothetical protein